MNDLTLPPKVDEYLECLIYRGYPAAAAVNWARVLGVAALFVGEEGLDVSPDNARDVCDELVHKGVPRETADEIEEIIGAYLQWQAEPVRPLTEERIAELAALEAENSLPVPDHRDVVKLLAAPDPTTRAGLRDAIALHMSAYWGLSPSALCKLQVEEFEFETTTGRDGVTLNIYHGDRQLRIGLAECGSPEDILSHIPKSGPLLRGRADSAVSERSLRRRLKKYVDSLEEELTEPLNFQTLRDHAVYALLNGGATWEYVARSLGYSDVASVKRRYAGPSWAYLADREGHWFDLESAAQAENMDPEQLGDTANASIPHRTRGRSIFIRKEDVRRYFHPPLHTLAPPTPESQKWPPSDPRPGISDALGLDGSPIVDELMSLANPEVAGQMWESRHERKRAPDHSPADECLEELAESTREWFVKLGALRDDDEVPNNAVERVCKLVDCDTEAMEMPKEFHHEVLWEKLCHASPKFASLVGMVGAVNWSSGGVAAFALHTQLYGKGGFDCLEELLSQTEAAVYFWLLVDHHFDQLNRFLQVSCEYYGLSKSDCATYGFGAFMYAFLVGLVLAHPRVPLEYGASTRTHDELLWECMRHWYIFALSQTDALETDAEGYPIYFPRLRQNKSIEESIDDFLDAFEKRWQRFDRATDGGRYPHVLPAVSMSDMLFYEYVIHTTRKHRRTRIAYAVTDFVVHLAKLPPARLLCEPVHKPRHLLVTLLHLMYLPMMYSFCMRAIEDVIEATDCNLEYLVGLFPNGESERLRKLISSCIDSFNWPDVERDPSGSPHRTKTRSSFTPYLRRAIIRYRFGLYGRLRDRVYDNLASVEQLMSEEPDETYSREGEFERLSEVPSEVSEANTIDPKQVLRHLETVESDTGETWLIVPEESVAYELFCKLMAEEMKPASSIFPKGIPPDDPRLHPDTLLIKIPDDATDLFELLARDAPEWK